MSDVMGLSAESYTQPPVDGNEAQEAATYSIIANRSR